MPLTASGDSWSGGVPDLATTTFGSGSGLLLPLLSGQMESSITLSPRLRPLAPRTSGRGPSPEPPSPQPACPTAAAEREGEPLGLTAHPPAGPSPPAHSPAPPRSPPGRTAP